MKTLDAWQQGFIERSIILYHRVLTQRIKHAIILQSENEVYMSDVIKQPNYMSTEEVAGTFQDFYLSKGFHLVKDSGVIPQDDPTLLFINSGMAPLKPYFTGQQQPPHNLLTNIQNCIRTGDIDDIGDSYHGTSFNMMGSWLFGPMFSKERSTELAHELITGGFGLDNTRLFASVLDNSAIDRGIPADTESITAWRRFMPEDRVIPLPAVDNLWGPPGDSGPCGPCTEVFYDRGKAYEESNDTKSALQKDRHIEIWNAGVFMEYHMDKDGTVTPLPSKSVDGGAGLERFAMVLQDAPSIHQIDRWLPVYDTIRPDVSDDRSARIIADHLKTSEILAQSGVRPGNKMASYILRRLLRKTMGVMVQEGIDLSRIKDYQSAVQAQLPSIPGAVVSRQDSAAIFSTEEAAFAKVLARSEKLLAPYLERGKISGEAVHTLHATHGVPVDLVREACHRNGLAFPEAEYKAVIPNHTRES